MTLAAATRVSAQAGASAQISGSIADPSGAVVPNAKVTATQTNTGQVRTPLTGQDGTYVLTSLAVGPYKLEVQVSGFQTYVQTGINLQVSDNPTVNVMLHVGPINQQVEVTANAKMVQTQSTSVSQVIDQRSIIDPPLDGRQATSLIMLSGAANDTPPIYSDLITSKNSDPDRIPGGEAAEG